MAKRDVGKALELLLPLAAKKNARALNYIGVDHYWGLLAKAEGIYKDEHLAFVYSAAVPRAGRLLRLRRIWRTPTHSESESNATTPLQPEVHPDRLVKWGASLRLREPPDRQVCRVRQSVKWIR